MDQRHIPGLSLAVIKGGNVVREQSYGLANVELEVPATKDTVYEIASITKSFTATAIMLLVEDGQLGLDVPLTRYRPGLPPGWDQITVRHLLAHTSGVVQWSLDWDRPDLTMQEIGQAVFDQPLRFAPGEQCEYTDTNYNLLGMLIHRVAGVPYDQFLQERVFGPLGMTATRHNDVRAIVPHRAGGYEWEDGCLLNAYRIAWNHMNVSPDVPANGANGSLLSSLADLIIWDAALRTGRILPQAVLERMWTPATLRNGTPAHFGLGWELGQHRGHRLVEHGGGLPGFTTSLARFVDDDLTIIILTNQDSKPWDMARAVAELYQSAPPVQVS
jgi:CubicO group peptidase (beta-lactamase class C family)